MSTCLSSSSSGPQPPGTRQTALHELESFLVLVLAAQRDGFSPGYHSRVRQDSAALSSLRLEWSGLLKAAPDPPPKASQAALLEAELRNKAQLQIQHGLDLRLDAPLLGETQRVEELQASRLEQLLRAGYAGQEDLRLLQRWWELECQLEDPRDALDWSGVTQAQQELLRRLGAPGFLVAGLGAPGMAGEGGWQQMPNNMQPQAAGVFQFNGPGFAEQQQRQQHIFNQHHQQQPHLQNEFVEHKQADGVHNPPAVGAGGGLFDPHQLHLAPPQASPDPEADAPEQQELQVLLEHRRERATWHLSLRKWSCLAVDLLRQLGGPGYHAKIICLVSWGPLGGYLNLQDRLRPAIPRR